MWSVLQNPSFRRLWLAQIFSETGDWIRNMALLLWVFHITDGHPLSVSVITVCEYAPILLVTPIAGVWVDRWNRVKTMIGADLLRALTIGLVAVALLTEWVPLAYLCALLAGSFQAFFDPARTSVVASTVPRDQLVQANSCTQVTRNTLRVLGPMIGTGLYALAGAPVSFTLDALSFLLSALLLRGLLRLTIQAPPRPRKKVWSELREGFSYTVFHPMLRPMLIAGLTLGIGLGSYNSLLIFVVTDSLHLDEKFVGLLNSVQGVAMLTSALVIGLLFGKIQRHKLVTVGLFLIGVGIFVVGLAPNLLLAGVGRLIVGFGGTTLNIGLVALIQTFVANEFLGRVSGLLEPLIVGSMMASAAAAGFLLDLISITPLLMWNGAIVLLSSLVALLLFRIGQGSVAKLTAEQTATTQE
ncbi:MAG TPA: MFS transporter [Bacilli bacterium]|nr:MFS transporter [Bacilli bacterium]